MSIFAKYIPLILFTVLTNAAAQIMLKRGMLSVGGFSMAGSSVIDFLLRTFLNPYVFTGLCIFVISMVSHLIVLSKVELSFAYPFLSLAYVVVAAYAFFVFQEDVSAIRVGGIALICAGTILIAQS
jgi:multidrug transporter EmrE-like cation transporter